MPPILARGNKPDHPLLGECITCPPQSWPLSNGRPPTEVTPFNVPRHVLPWSPLALIGEYSQFTGFAPPSSSTPYESLMREPPPPPPPGYPTASPSCGAPSTFMELLSQMIHSQLETPRTPSHLQGVSTFREPY